MQKDKTYYREVYDKRWLQCYKEAEEETKDEKNPDISLCATEIFEEVANAEEIVGYYLTYHGDDALRDWRNNIEGLHLTEQDKQVDAILDSLFS